MEEFDPKKTNTTGKVDKIKKPEKIKINEESVLSVLSVHVAKRINEICEDLGFELDSYDTPYAKVSTATRRLVAKGLAQQEEGLSEEGRPTLRFRLTQGGIRSRMGSSKREGTNFGFNPKPQET